MGNHRGQPMKKTIKELTDPNGIKPDGSEYDRKRTCCGVLMDLIGHFPVPFDPDDTQGLYQCAKCKTVRIV